MKHFRTSCLTKPGKLRRNLNLTFAKPVWCHLILCANLFNRSQKMRKAGKEKQTNKNYLQNKGLQRTIFSKLSIHLSADRVTIDLHNETIKQKETSLNNTQARIKRPESTRTDLTNDNEVLKLKVDDLEDTSMCNNIHTR